MRNKEDIEDNTLGRLTETQQEEIARLIKEGYKSGRLDEEDGWRVHWELGTTIWDNNK